MEPMQFTITHTDEVLVSHSGLALIGALLKQSPLRKRLNEIRLGERRRPEVPHGDVLVAMTGLLCLGKSDYADIESYRHEEFFRRALGLQKLPSEETLRQRMDQLGTMPVGTLHEESARLIARHAPALTPCHGDWIPLDIDVSPFDNSGTKKEGVALTYKKLDGYAPNFAYLGMEGYLIHCELRPGNQHCQEGTPEFLDQAIELARQATQGKLLVRMDAGNDDGENLRRLRKKKHVDWIIKRNLRRESEADWLEEAQAHGDWEFPREGKEVYTGETSKERDGKLYRVVFEVIQRTIAADGQRLLVPDIEIATWWTSLKLSPKTVIALYHQHGTSEQFHSELKSDLDLERLPSGKFATNALMLSLGLVAYNLLRLSGQTALTENDNLPPEAKMPVSKPVFRRRLRSVIQDLMYFAARLTKHSNRWGLSLWRSNPWRSIWESVYERFLRPITPASDGFIPKTRH
jgi:hypothetical protein